MRVTVIVVLGAMLSFPACIASRTTCGVADLQLAASGIPELDWRLVRVNPDGSAVLMHGEVEREFAAPVEPPGHRPCLLATSYELQTATVRVGFCDQTIEWSLWPR